MKIVLKVAGWGASIYVLANLFKKSKTSQIESEPENPAPPKDVDPAPKTEVLPDPDLGEIQPTNVPKELPPPEIKSVNPPRPKRPSTNKKEGDKVDKKPLSKEPEKYSIICRGGAVWDIVIKLHLPSAKRTEFDKTFQQNNMQLSFDHNGECILQDYSSAITCEDGDIDLSINNCHIFRFAENWGGEGKNARKTLKGGYYLVIAPKTQKRINKSPSVHPENCSDNDFLAHYFHVADEDDGFEGCNNSFISGGFSLSGETIYDRSENGDLFISPPKLVSDNQPVAWIKINEIGSGNWGEVIPSEKTMADALGQRTGAFGARICDNQKKTLDRMYFRVTSMLKKILINGVEYSKDTVLFPSSAGHRIAQIRFVGANGSNLHLRPKSKNPYISISEDGVVSIEPHPDGDFSQWILEENDGNQLDVDIALPRVWWRIGKSEEWRSKPLTMTHEKLRNLNENIEISIPANIRHLMVGIKGARSVTRPVCLDRDKVNRAVLEIKCIWVRSLVRDDSAETELELQSTHGDMVLPLIYQDAYVKSTPVNEKEKVVPRPKKHKMNLKSKRVKGWKKGKSRPKGAGPHGWIRTRWGWKNG